MYEDPAFYVRLFDDSLKMTFEVPPGCTKVDEIIKQVPVDPKLYFLQRSNSDYVLSPLFYSFLFDRDKISDDSFKDAIITPLSHPCHN